MIIHKLQQTVSNIDRYCSAASVCYDISGIILRGHKSARYPSRIDNPLRTQISFIIDLN